MNSNNPSCASSASAATRLAPKPLTNPNTANPNTTIAATISTTQSQSQSQSQPQSQPHSSLSPNRYPASMAPLPSPNSLKPSSPAATSPSSTNQPYRSLRPRRSAASLRSIPERRSKELEPPLPVPATPWIEPATPGILTSNNADRPVSASSTPSDPEQPSSQQQQQSSVYPDPQHLQPNPPSPRQARLEDQYTAGPHTVPGPRDQSSLSRYRLASQPLTSRHSEGSQYASSSNWTPSSNTGSRIEFDHSVHGIRSSIASRDSRFTAETDYNDDYCYPKQPPPSHAPHSHSHSQALNLSVSASWHGGDQSSRNFSGPPPAPQTRPAEPNPPPSLISLIKLDQTRGNNQGDVVGLGITSDETISITRGSRSPSLTSGNEAAVRAVSHAANASKTSRSARSASSSVSNSNTSNLSPFNPLHSRPSRITTASGERSTLPKPMRPEPLQKSFNNLPEEIYIPPNHPGPDHPSIFSPNAPSHTAPNILSLDFDPTSSSLPYQGLPYDSSASSHLNSTSSIASCVNAGVRRHPSDHSEFIHEKPNQVKSTGHFAEVSTDSKSALSRPQSHWDDFDDKSPSLNGPSQIPSQAIALVEEGRGCIVDISTSHCSLEKLEVPDDTTHLLLAKTFSPFVMGALLSSRLPIIATNLVVLDISDTGLNSLPSAIALCEALEELNISGNVMASGELPAFLCHLTSLKVLAADRCGLHQVATSYGGLSHLRDLSVRFNHLKCLPSWLSLLPRLEILLVDGNEFEPPWQELVEPLLFSNCYSRLDSQQLPSISSSDFADWRYTTPSSPSLNISSLGPNVKPPAESALTVPFSNDEPRPNGVSTERSVRGRRHLGTQNNNWVKSASSVVSDQLDGPDDRPQSACSAEASFTNLSRRSYLRRLRSASDMRSEVPRRSISTQEQTEHLVDLLAASDIADDEMRDSPEPLPQRSGSRKPSLSSALQASPTSCLNPAEGSNRPTHMTPHGVRPDPRTLSATEVFPSSSNDSNYNLASMQAQPNKDHQKKSFGFLKKMSLGKLRRELPRPRTASIDAFSRVSQNNNLYSKPTCVSSEILPWESSQLTPGAVTPKENDAPAESDGVFKKPPNNVLKLGDCNPPLSVSKKKSNRRSYLKLEHSIPPLMLNTINKPPTLHEEHTIEESPTSKPGDPHAVPVSKGGEATGVVDVQGKTSQVIPIHHPLTSLRSIMMYLRDVHDLSGEAYRPHGSMVTNATRSVQSSSVSRATSTKHFPNSNALNDGRTTPVVPHPPNLVDLEPDSLDSPTTNLTMIGGSGVQEAPELVKVTDNALRRLKVIEEILATEKSYIKGLKELHDIYITSASMMVSSSIGKEKEPMVPPAERKIVFNNVEAIIGFHVDVLLPDFQEVMDRLWQKQAGIVNPEPDQPGASELSSKRRQVESQLTNIAAEELARVFIRHAAFLKLYSTYITQFESALERLREWSVTAPASSSNASAWAPSSSHSPNNAATNHTSTMSGGQKKRLKTYMKRCRAHTSHTQMNLESYLLMPVQRLPRYKLLLENLVSCTPDLHSISIRDNDSKLKLDAVQDKKLPTLAPNKIAVEALNIVSAVTAEMNERKRDSEGRQRLLYWQQRFGNRFRSPLVQPHRTLIKEGTMILMRTVKLAFKDTMASGHSAQQSAPKNRVPMLHTDNQSIPIIVLLCTDLLVLVKDPGDGGRATNQTPASLFQALRLAQHSRPQVNLPATLFGVDRTIIRFVDNRAIFYFQCDCQSSAAAWMVAINQQVPLL